MLLRLLKGYRRDSTGEAPIIQKKYSVRALICYWNLKQAYERHKGMYVFEFDRKLSEFMGSDHTRVFNAGLANLNTDCQFIAF